MDLKIQVNKGIIKRIKGLNFQSDNLGSVLLILLALYENQIELLDEFDDYNKQKRAIMLYKEIELKGLIERNEDYDKPNFILTKRGTDFIEDLKKEFGIDATKVAILGADSILSKDRIDWIEEWVDLFPRGVKSGGKLVRSDKAGCEKKMIDFIKQYGYSKETIMEATRRYVENRAQVNYEFMRCAIYFIFRKEDMAHTISDLAAECELLEHNKNNPKTNSDDMI